MVRGLKKKLLIGLLSAAVVGTSLAPSVPLVGSFAQEVKADETTSQKVNVTAKDKDDHDVTNEVTINKPAHSTVNAAYNASKLTITVTPDAGYRLVDAGRIYDVTVGADGKLSQTTFDSGASVALIKETLTVSKGADIADGLTYTLDKSELDINNTKAVLTIKAKDGRKFKEAPEVNGGQTTKVDDSTYKYEYTRDVNAVADKTTDLKITGGEYEVLSNIKVDDSKLSGATVSVSKTTGITKDDQVTVTVSPQAKCKFGQNAQGAPIIPTIVADGVKGSLGFKPDGDKYVVTIPAGDFTKDDVKLTIEGTATYTDSETQKTTNSKGTTSTINKGVKSTAKVSANADGVYEAVKAAGFISTELEDLATTIEEKVLSVTADIKPTADGDNLDSIKTAIQDDDLKLGYSFVITINKVYDKVGAVDPATTTLRDLGNNLITYTITIPEDQRGKKTYKVYRIHNGVVDRLTTEPNANGEYIHVTSDSIQVHASKFSVFAIGYSDEEAVTPEEEDPNKEDPTKEDDNKPGTITPSNGTVTTATTSTAKAATSTTKAAKATTSTKKSSKTSSPKTADYAVNSLLALLTGAAGLFGITLINKKRKEDEE